MELFKKNELKQAMFFLNKIVAAKACQEEIKIQKENKELIKKTKKQFKAFVKKQKAFKNVKQ